MALPLDTFSLHITKGKNKTEGCIKLKTFQDKERFLYDFGTHLIFIWDLSFFFLWMKWCSTFWTANYVVFLESWWKWYLSFPVLHMMVKWESILREHRLWFCKIFEIYEKCELLILDFYICITHILQYKNSIKILVWSYADFNLLLCNII